MSKKKNPTTKELRKERKAKKKAALLKLNTGKSQKCKNIVSEENNENQQDSTDITLENNVADDAPVLNDVTTCNDVNMPEVPETCADGSTASQRVRIRIKGIGQEASLDAHHQERIPLLLSDIQHLLLATTLDSHHPYSSPRWMAVDKRSHLLQTAVLIVDGLSIDHYLSNDVHLPLLKKFSIKTEVVTPSLYGGSIIDELATVPLTDSEKESLVQEYGSIEAAVSARKDLMVMLGMVFPVKKGNTNSLNNNSVDNFPRTQLILSAWQLVEENYPLPLKGKLMNSYAGYIMTKDVYEPVSASSPMFGLDCEMCKTVAGNELTRISVVDEAYQVIYEKLVLPHNKIIDYLTRFSGITPDMMANVQTRLSDVQRDIREILPPNAILVGQSLNFDLHALKMMHPYIIDTSVIFNTTGERGKKSKLKILAKTFLKQDIQEGTSGHCSVEDSIASLKLVQLKLANNIVFGDAILSARNKLTQENQRKISRTEYSTSIFNKVAQHEKSSIIIGHESITQKYLNYVKKVCKVNKSDSGGSRQRKIKCINCEDNEGVIENTKSSLSGKHNLVMSHINVGLDYDSRGEGVFHTVNTWVGDLFQHSPPNTLLVVLFSGTTSCNGASFVHIKK